MGFFARVFITFEHPGLSTFGQIYSTLMMLLIFTSCTCYVLATMPEFMYIPTKNKCAGKWCEDAWKICRYEPLTFLNPVQFFHLPGLIYPLTTTPGDPINLQ